MRAYTYNTVGSIQDLKTGGCRFDHWHSYLFLRTENSHHHRIHYFLNTELYSDDSYVEMHLTMTMYMKKWLLSLTLYQTTQF